MTQPITIGRIALALLMVVGLTTATGIGAAEPIDGKGNDVLTSLDGKGNDVFAVLDGTGDDSLHTVFAAFPINNVTVVSATYVGRGGGSGKPSL